jgi:hypothetical protein
MPALPIVHLKTSNTHNFWTVAPKIMKFALMQSLFRDASAQKVFKNLKIVWDHTTQPITGLSLVRSSGPLGVNENVKKESWYLWLHKSQHLLPNIYAIPKMEVRYDSTISSQLPLSSIILYRVFFLHICGKAKLAT